MARARRRDELSAADDGAALLTWLGVLAALFEVLATAGLYGYHSSDRVQMRVEHDLRMMVVGRALDPAGGVERGWRSGELVGLTAGDAPRGAGISWAISAAAAVVAVLVCLVALVVASPLLGALVVVGVPVVLAVAHRVTGPLRRRSEREQEVAAGAAAAATDLVGGLRVLAGLGAQRAASARYRRESRRVLVNRVASARALGAYEATTLTIIGLFMALVAWAGARLADAGTISVGELIAVLGLALFLARPLEPIADAIGVVAAARASAARIGRVLDAAPARTHGRAVAAGGGAGVVEIGHLRVAPGDFVTVDADPATARRLADALGAHADRVDAVRVDGVGVGDIAAAELRAVVHVADHDPWLPSGSLGAALAGVPAEAIRANIHRLFDPVMMLLGLVDVVQDATASPARLVGVTRMPVPAQDGDHPSPEPVLRLDEVHAAHRDGPPVLHGVSLEVARGEHVAVVGPSGAGKTTLARLAAATHHPTGDRVTLGGRTPGEVGAAGWRARVAVVTQEVHVFAGTLADDLRLAAPEASDAELREALARVGAAGLVEALDDGLATVVGEGGHRLTPIEAQQVALARVVPADPPIVILDEATAEAGSTGAAALEASAAACVEGRSALVIAHRLSHAARADRVIVLDGGAIVEQGTHDELAAAGGGYARLWAAWSRAGIAD